MKATQDVRRRRFKTSLGLVSTLLLIELEVLKLTHVHKPLLKRKINIFTFHSRKTCIQKEFQNCALTGNGRTSGRPDLRLAVVIDRSVGQTRGRPANLWNFSSATCQTFLAVAI